MTFSQEIAGIEARLTAAGKTIGDLCEAAAINRTTWTRWKAGLVSPRLTTWNAVQSATEKLARREPAESPTEDLAPSTEGRAA
jgi:hypothetical protein